MSIFDSISKKVMLGYSAILVLLIITATFLYQESTAINEQKDYFAQKTLPALRNAENATANLSAMQIAAFGLYSTSLEQGMFTQQVEQYDAKLDELIRSLEQLPFAKSLGLKAEKETVWTELGKLQQIMSAGRVDWDGAREQLNIIQSASEQFRSKLDKVKSMVSEQAEDASAKISHEIALMRGLIIFSVVAIALITLLAFGFSQRSIVKPVKSLSEQLDDVAVAKDLRQNILVDTNDEISDAASSVNQLLVAFREGNMEIQHSASAMLSSVEKLNMSARLSDDQVLTFFKQVSELFNKIEVLENCIEVSANRSLSASEMARTGAQQVKQGAENVSKTSNSISVLASDVERSAEMLLSLKNAGDKVGSVVKTIAEIAEQTNLLALNAAIEAARAGESGRGFAVVADEVRTLASRTHDSTHEINKILDTIVSSISSTVTTMDSNKAKANESVALAESTVVSLGEITNTVEALSNENHDLANLAQDIKANASAMRSSVDEIEAASTAVRDTSKETRSAANELSGVSRSLNEVANRFRV
ncbi:methyl-accepting chemotaxis protein [Paraneptunicella aestuarii]|uniref:methyl-accepting chemotaxis protein n=1 Tax=Paraneptunicella aestuarii TaxID=2831148 RepID=UPI001E312136|nr:methyl-accepting chemotaxis protein [Paraneptunicella aestuarii]UAA37818.1 methyl-accepting chemotaxis protein [Paraneptunicella aestuarii]